MSLSVDGNVVVSIHYTLKNDDGELIDSSEGESPLTYLHGAGNIIPGLEKALTGKVVNDKVDVRIEPSEGYGEIIPEMIHTMDKSAFHGVDQVEVGMAFDAQGADGSAQNVVVTKVEGDQVTIDANHPLAGIALNFNVEVVDLREATKEEVDHGHVH